MLSIRKTSGLQSVVSTSKRLNFRYLTIYGWCLGILPLLFALVIEFCHWLQNLLWIMSAGLTGTFRIYVYGCICRILDLVNILTLKYFVSLCGRVLHFIGSIVIFLLAEFLDKRYIVKMNGLHFKIQFYLFFLSLAGIDFYWCLTMGSILL